MNEIIFYRDKNVIYKNLRYYRKKRKLTQDQLAAKMQLLNVNLDQRLISRIENNLRVVTDFELACFCRVLGVTEREMLSDFREKYPE